LKVQRAAESSKSEKIDIGNTASKYLSNYAMQKMLCMTECLEFTQKNDGKMFIGKKKLSSMNNDIIIDGERYDGTRGLWELITRSST
jgi:hypothetical protein